MRQLLFAAAALAALAAPAAPARADEIADALRAALEAYEAGDLAVAREEADYAVQLLAQKKAGDLTAFLPEPPAGWTREVSDAASGGVMTMFGGGLTAEGVYASPAGDSAEVRLIADSPMLAAMAAMFSSPAAMGAMGRVTRIKRVNFAVGQDGEIQGMIGGKVLIQVSGSAAESDKVALIEAIDFEALEGF